MTPETAVEIIKTFNTNATIRSVFKTLAAYSEHVEQPNNSPFKIVKTDGKTVIVAREIRELTPSERMNVLYVWQTDESVRATFKSIDDYRFYTKSIFSVIPN